MNLVRKIAFWNRQIFDIQRYIKVRFLIQWIFLSAVIISCEEEPHGLHPFNEDILTIGEYLKRNQQEYSKFHRLLIEGKMLIPLSAYNPHGEGYTLFLPTDEAIDHFIRQNQDYENFEEMLLDTGFIYRLTRYHTVKRKVRTEEFPHGALNDSTLTGERLVTGFYSDGDNQLIKVNNEAPVIKSNMDMTNGYIHIVSKVLQPVEIAGYDWLQQQDGYSILAEAMEYSRIRINLWFNKYTILAEHDSIYHRKGIMNLEDLLNHVAPPEAPNAVKTNSLYKFAAYHIIGGEFYLNDLHWGNQGYRTLGNEPVRINLGFEIRINPGIDIYGITITESGDTTVIDYISPVWEDCNIMTRTGPVHSISDVLSSKPLHYK